MDFARTIERSRTAVVALSIAATALLIFLATYDQFILPKIVWVKVLTEILAVLTAARMAAGGDFRVRVHPLNFALFLFVTWKAVSGFWAESRSLAADDIRWWTVLLVWSLLFQDWMRRDRQRLMVCSGALTLSVFLLALWVVLQDFGIAFFQAWTGRLMALPVALRDPLRWLLDRLTGARTTIVKLPDWRGWLWAGMGNTNHIADYMALLYPMVAMQYLLARGKWREILTLATLTITYAALIACWSVGSNGGLILAGLAMLGFLIAQESRQFWRQRALRISVLAVLLAAVTAFYVFPHRMNPHPGGIFPQAFASERWQAGWPTRAAIWLTSLTMIRHHPWLGIGAGNFTYGYTETLSPRVSARPDLAPYAGVYTNAAHNEPLQAWVETGVVGLLLLLLLWGLFFRSVVGRRRDKTNGFERRLRIVLFAAMVAFIAHALMNFTLQLPTSSLLFVGLMAVAATFRRRDDEFALTVRSSYPGLEIDIETTGMRRIESVGFRLGPSPSWRAMVVGAALALGAGAVTASIRPLLADVHFNQAKMAVRLGAPPAVAEGFARRSLALNPNHHAARKLLGVALLEMGRYGEAREAFEKVRERETVFDFYKELGRACWQMGDREAAGRYWTVYFSRCPQTRRLDADFFAFFAREFPQEAGRLSKPQKRL
jgi:O-antigen ligase